MSKLIEEDFREIETLKNLIPKVEKMLKGNLTEMAREEWNIALEVYKMKLKLYEIFQMKDNLLKDPFRSFSRNNKKQIRQLAIMASNLKSDIDKEF